MTRYAHRVDANQRDVMVALERAGFDVEVIKKPLDLQVGSPRTKRFMLMEVKVIGGRQTEFQKGYLKRWNGYPVSLVDGPECAVRHAMMLEDA